MDKPLKRFIARLQVLFILVLMLSCSILYAQERGIETLISIKVHQKSIDEVLKKLSAQTGFSFSYSPTLLATERKISIDLYQRPLSEALTTIFEGKAKYKLKGKYIILSLEDGSTLPSKWVLRGYVREALSQQPIPYASIYVPSQWSAHLSNQYGYFEISIATQHTEPLKVLFSKQKYWSKEIQLTTMQDQFVEIRLPLQRNDSLTSQQSTLAPDSLMNTPIKIDSIRTTQKQSKADEIRAAVRKNYAKIAFPLADFFLSMKQKIHLGNVNDRFFRDFQFSVLPSLSTNKLLNVSTVNQVSFNLLGGYNQGVEIVELGGLFNMNKGNVRFLQAAGLFNMVGGNSAGLQVGGIYNRVGKNLWGLQVAGLLNQNQKNLDGLQVAGLVNLLKKNLAGMQVAGLLNLTQQKVAGVQVAGLLNLNTDRLQGAQVAGLVNARPQYLRGIQLAGLANFSKRQTRSVQIAGLLNHTHFANGGLQLGLINWADSARRLVPVGLLSFIKKGQSYRRLALSVDELLNVQLSFKTGVPALYNIITIGRQNFGKPAPALLLGYGLGTSIFSKSNWRIEFTLEAANVRQAKDPWLRNALLKNNCLIERKLGKHFSFAVGGGLRAWLRRADQSFGQYFENSLPVLLYEGKDDEIWRRVWLGYQGSIRWVL